ncbi:hypothetical protein SAMN02787144_101917 [Streptomyces atratus]|uniref:Uncharacterized protein n=2 Tax=Streptomyces atratus TaxID=1893 RepID=A0A1K2EGN2_STRAR|nr:hypothetical protein SAMN02787144_101917 [Streptomyces atratus]
MRNLPQLAHNSTFSLRTVRVMAPRTRNPGSDWLASCASDPVQVHRTWATDGLALIRAERRWVAVEADLMRSVHALQHIAPDRLGPLLVRPGEDLAWWLAPPYAEALLAGIPGLRVRPEGQPLRCPPAERYIDGLGWLEKPDGAGRLTDPAELGAAFDVRAACSRLPAAAFG